MNINFKRLPLDRICVIDIETVRGKETITRDDPEFAIIKDKYKDKDTLVPLPDEQVNIKYRSHAPLNPAMGNIVCTSLAVYDESQGFVVTKSYVGEERDILKRVNKVLKDSKLLVAGHNVVGFDIPFFRRRFHALGLHFEEVYYSVINDSGAKPWDLEKDVIDIMALAKGTMFLPPSLKELCFEYGLRDPKDDLKASEVSEAYFKGDIGRIAEYCEKDVAAVANIILLWRGSSPWPVLSQTFSTLVGPYPEDDVEEVSIEGMYNDSGQDDSQAMSPIQELIYSDEIGQDLEERLINYIGAIEEGEQDSIRAMLLAIYMNPKELKAGKESKTLEIDELVKQIPIIKEEK